MWKARPNALNDTNARTFETEQEAITYLESMTGQTMERDYRRARQNGKLVTLRGKSDWELVGKLQRVA